MGNHYRIDGITEIVQKECLTKKKFASLLQCTKEKTANSIIINSDQWSNNNEDQLGKKLF